MKAAHPIHDFQYKNGELFCEGVKVSAIAKRVGTPVYIYSHRTLVEHVLYRLHTGKERGLVQLHVAIISM
ncbi:MAG: hypothetical protein GX606_03850, partial [Elusimicrobia bacterium]|nr:hypothetical protein [Elusimicrobiota bacterium]